MPWYITALITWHITGGLALSIIWVESLRPVGNNNILSPIWIYDEYELNYFKTGLVCLIFNLLCPMFSVLWWFYKFSKFIFTLGRN